MVRLNTFEQVKDRYKNTKVLVSKRCPVEYDIRPIGRRDIKEERIHKISDTCYALVDYNTDEGAAAYGKRLGFHPKNDHHIERFAPIVWYSDGTVKLRNVDYRSPISRHKFLRTYLPWGLDLPPNDGNGLHFIEVSRAFKEPLRYFFPKYDAKDPSDTTVLWFKQVREGSWVHTGDEYEAPRLHNLVDKVAKKEFQPHYEAFYEWLEATVPLLPLKDRGYVVQHIGTAHRLDHIEWRAAIKDLDHPNRMAVAVFIADQWSEIVTYIDHSFPYNKPNSIKHVLTYRTKAQRRNVFHRIINKHCGFNY